MTVPPLVPTSLPWVYDLIVGQEWPAGDEDALRRCAQAWTEALGALVGIAEGGDDAARFVGYSVQSVSSDQFDSYWSKYTRGDDSVVGQMAQQCQGLAELLLQDAEQIEFTKLSINIQVVILAIQLTIDIATAIVTAGASMAEGAAAAMAARFTVKQLLVELLKGALMAVAPDLITQTVMLAEGHRSSIDVGEALQAAGQGALGAGIGMAVGGVTGRLAKSLTGGLAADAAESLGGKLLTHAVDAGNAVVTGALTNMATTAVTDLAGGQSLDNVWGAGLNGAANGLLFHGAHALGEGIGAAGRPEPTHFSLAGGGDLHGLPLSDGSLALFDPNGMKHGTGVFDPQSGQLTVRPVAGEPYRVGATTQERPGAVAQHGEPVSAHEDPAPTHDSSAPTREAPVSTREAPASLGGAEPTPEQPVAQHRDPASAGGVHAEPGSSPDPSLSHEPVPHAAPAPGPTPSEPTPADGSPQGSAPHPARTASLAAAEPIDPAATRPVAAPVERSTPQPENPAPAMSDAMLGTGNRILDELTAAATPTRQEARPERPEQRPETFSSLGTPRDLPPRKPGKWTPNDANWQNTWNKAKGSMPSDVVIERWSKGKPAPNARTYQDLVNDENAFLATKMKDPQRRSFHTLAAEILEERHKAVQPVLEQVLKDMGTGELRGLDNHRKFAESLDRKFDQVAAVKELTYTEFPPDLATLTAEDRAEAVAKARAKLDGLSLDVNDPLRYTMVLDEATYARGAQETLKALHAAGYRLLDVVKVGDETVPGARPLLLQDGRLPDAEFAKNFWREGNRYLGINLSLVDKHGGPFELQFHTPRSFDLKQYLSHDPYEMFRKDGTPPERRVNAMLELVAMSDNYLKGHVPGDLEKFAPPPKDNSLDTFFEKLVAKHAGDARVAAAVDFEQKEIKAINLELADQLNAVAQGGLGEAAGRRAISEIAGLIQARAELLGAAAQPASEHPGPQSGERHQSAVAHTEPGEHTSLGPSAHEQTPADPALAHHPALHLEHPIPLAEDHLLFPFRDDQGNLAWAHLQQSGGRWVLHAGGPEGEHLTALAENLRTPPPGLDLIGHATPEGFLLGGKTVPFEDVLAQIPHSPRGPHDEGPIRLIACDAGGATGEAAQRLADRSGRKVIAADTPVWLAKDGSVLASNPVDRATNWYPKRPADGVWKEYEPGLKAEGGYRHVPAQDISAEDPRLPQEPAGWREARLASAPETHPGREFVDLGNDRNALPAAAGDSSAAYARNPVQEAVNLEEPLPAEAKREMSYTVIGNELRAAGANRHFEEAAAEKIAVAATQFTRSDLAEAYKNHSGRDRNSARPLRRKILDEVVAMNHDGLLELVKGRTATNGEKRISSFVKIGDIVVEQSVTLAKPQPSTVRIESFPRGHHSYDLIAKDLGEFCVRLKSAGVANPDEHLARAMKRLLSEQELTPQERTHDLRELAAKAAGQEFDAGRDREPLTEEEFVQIGGSLAHLVGHLEPARDPRALMNLVNLDIAAHGGMTVADAVWFFNPVSQAGGARQALQAHIRILSETDNIPDLLDIWKNQVGKNRFASLNASNSASYFHDIEEMDHFWPQKQKLGPGVKRPTIEEQKDKFVQNLENERGRAEAFAARLFTLADGDGWERSQPPVTLPEGAVWERVPPRGSYSVTERGQWETTPFIPADPIQAVKDMTRAQFQDLLRRAAIGAAVQQDAEVELRMRNALARSIVHLGGTRSASVADIMAGILERALTTPAAPSGGGSGTDPTIPGTTDAS